MLTDEQINIACNAYQNYDSLVDVDGIEAALKAYDDSKWIKFDINDKSTWPTDWQTVNTYGIDTKKEDAIYKVPEALFVSFDLAPLIKLYGECAFSRSKQIDFYPDLTYYKVIAWQPLPKQPEGLE